MYRYQFNLLFKAHLSKVLGINIDAEMPRPSLSLYDLSHAIVSLDQGWENLRFLKIKFRFFRFLVFFRFLGFNVRTVARGTLDTGILLRRRPIHEDN